VAWANPLDELVDRAEREAGRHGLNALDALHVAAAMMTGADELVTTEGLQKPMHRVTDVNVVTI
jgi:predicted nucleic acid-binding protein